jgi:hypothetical protein
VEYQAEVALLTRRILFTSDATSTSTGIGTRKTVQQQQQRQPTQAYSWWVLSLTIDGSSLWRCT